MKTAESCGSGIASIIERLPPEQKATGSIPVGGTAIATKQENQNPQRMPLRLP